MEELKFRQQLDQRLAQLRNERDKSWIPEWRDLRDLIAPRNGRFNGEQANDGKRKDQKIINNRAGRGARVLQAGMLSGMTSPSRPWFKLGAPDPGLMQYAPVKEWLFAVEKAMREVLARSNLYNVLPLVYGEEGVFGTAALAALPDSQDVVRFYPFTCGTYMLANSDRLQVDTMYREFRMTVRQLAQQFGKDQLSATVRGMLDTSPDAWIDVCHAVEPNEGHDTAKKDNQNMPYRSVYWEKSSDQAGLLRQSGFKTFPVMAPRWDVNGEDVYGTGPGSVCIGSVKALQLMERRKLQLIDKGVDPALLVPSSLQGKPMSILPGRITYYDLQAGASPVAPVYEPDPTWLANLRAEIQASEADIDNSFFVDLFLMVSQMDDVRTAFEVATRKEEKMLMLGPVLERQGDDLLDPVIDQVFAIMVEQSTPRWMGLLPGAPLLPPPPDELSGMDLRVEYTSILAEAQKILGVSNIERAISFAGNMAGQFPQVLDKINPDRAIDEYFDSIGVPPTMVRPADEVDQLRQQRAQAEQQQQMMEQASAGIQGAKLLSETDVSSENALTALAGAMQ